MQNTEFLSYNVGRRVYGARLSAIRYQVSAKTSYALIFAFCILIFGFLGFAFAQQGNDLEFNLDVTSNTIPLPKIFNPGIDLSGRGFHAQNTWPQTVAIKCVLDSWERDIGFSGFYRLQYNLWEIHELAKDVDAQTQLLRNYEDIIKKITDAGGVVILNIFSTPAGLGKALDKKSAPWDFKAFKALVKQQIKSLSCEKKYNIWYEVWNAPDIDDFFLGRKQEYFNLYRAVAEAIQELEAETKVHIPIGGPSASWWFQNLDGNDITTPEKSLIYEFIKFCYSHRLPIDFISWHGYSSDPNVEIESTRYGKTSVALIRDWLSYFHFDKNTPLIVDEWNYDSTANVLPERHERSNIAASYIFSRLANMYAAGIDHQIYYCLEDFQKNKEGVVRNLGVFWFDKDISEYKGGPKVIYNAFRILNSQGNQMYPLSKKNTPLDDFVKIIATKNKDHICLVFANYIDPQAALDYIAMNLVSFSDGERKVILNLIKSDELGKIIRKEVDIAKLRFNRRIKNLLKKAQDLNDETQKLTAAPRSLKITLQNLKEYNFYQRYVIDSTCTLNCDFAPQEEKEIDTAGTYHEILILAPYSVNMLIFKIKPKAQEAEVSPQGADHMPIPEALPQGKSQVNATLDNSAVSPKDK